MKVNAFIASLNPCSQNRDLAAFFMEAVDALGFASDADLARAMSVSAVTLASWKRRGKVPAVPSKWFQTIFPAMVFNRWRSTVPSMSSRAVAAALAATHRHYGDKLSDRSQLQEASIAFGGLLALVPLISNTHFDETEDRAIELSEDELAEILAGALEWRSKHPA